MLFINLNYWIQFRMMIFWIGLNKTPLQYTPDAFYFLNVANRRFYIPQGALILFLWQHWARRPALHALYLFCSVLSPSPPFLLHLHCDHGQQQQQMPRLAHTHTPSTSMSLQGIFMELSPTEPQNWAQAKKLLETIPMTNGV